MVSKQLVDEKHKRVKEVGQHEEKLKKQAAKMTKEGEELAKVAEKELARGMPSMSCRHWPIRWFMRAAPSRKMSSLRPIGQPWIRLSMQVWEFAANAGIKVDALPVMRTSC